MDFVTATRTGLAKYGTFEGRAQRAEYWYFTLFSFLVQLGLGIIDAALGTPLALVAALALLVPTIAVSVRRLHDIDKSGWWYLILFVPLVGIILLLVWACTKGTDGINRFGADPLGGEGSATPYPA